MPQSAISANPSALLDPARRFLRASPPTNIEWDRVGPTLADDKLPSRSPFGGLQRSFLFARHLHPSLSIFFSWRSLTSRTCTAMLSGLCSPPGLHQGHLGLPPGLLASQHLSFLRGSCIVRLPRSSATWCWLRASIEYTSIEAEKAILISSS